MNSSQAMKIKHSLVEAAARLESHSTPDWRLFIAGLGQYAELSMLNMLQADHLTVQNAQGRAAALNELLQMLYDPQAVLAQIQRLATPPQPKPPTTTKPAP